MLLIIYGFSIFMVFLLTCITWRVIYRDDGVITRKEIAFGLIAMALSFVPILGILMAIMGTCLAVAWMFENNEFNITTWFNQPAVQARESEDDGA
jgi:hypothetical protein